MKNKHLLYVCVMTGLILILITGFAFARSSAAVSMGNSFTYQGQLQVNGAPYSGSCDFQFALYDAETDGLQVGSTIDLTDVAVYQGFFTVQLDYGANIFTGDARWLEIWVTCPTGSGTYTQLAPRQAITPVPYALSLPGMWIEQNTTSSNLIGGYPANWVTSGVYGAVISGGGGSSYANYVTDHFGTVGGGSLNHAGDNDSTLDDAMYSTVCGGDFNQASSYAATIGGGIGNQASGSTATIGGGNSNMATGPLTTICGGSSNVASNSNATVGGGSYNQANAQYATVPGGRSNIAAGDYAFAAGYRAKANHMGSFVWGDSTDADIASTAINQFLIRSNGGLTLTVSSGALRLLPHATSPNLVFGYNGNGVTSGVYGAAVSGGGESSYVNSVTDNFGTVGGGGKNRAGDGNAVTTDAGYATISGGKENTASAVFATVGGGYHGTASLDAATVCGGYLNAASGNSSTVSGGLENTASAVFATVGGGYHSIANLDAATVCGGYLNTASGNSSTVSGGMLNHASGIEATVGGGKSNTASNQAATVSGGTGNIANFPYATIGGGSHNAASGSFATISGGVTNTVFSSYAFIGGGSENTSSNQYATVGGGSNNTASGSFASISGGLTNTVNNNYGFIGGGEFNTNSGEYASICGGRQNTANNSYATACGGRNNVASGHDATIGGGRDNDATGSHSTVGGGYYNNATEETATVSGGYSNDASGYSSSIGGGEDNAASGFYSTVTGGYHNLAQGDNSFASGTRAKANSIGCFVWGDSNEYDISCNDADRWVVRASGGVYFYTNSTLDSGMYLTAGGSSWNAVSTRELKENFAPVDKSQLLERLAMIDIPTWNYKAQDENILHIGPMADEFNALVDGLGGEGPDHINTLDADGVALAAIQGLYAENQQLKTQVEDLEARLSALERSSGSSKQSKIKLTLPWMLAFGLVSVGSGWLAYRRVGGGR